MFHQLSPALFFISEPGHLSRHHLALLHLPRLTNLSGFFTGDWDCDLITMLSLPLPTLLLSHVFTHLLINNPGHSAGLLLAHLLRYLPTLLSWPLNILTLDPG